MAAPRPLARELPAHTIKIDPKVQHGQRAILILIWGGPHRREGHDETPERHVAGASDGRHDHGLGFTLL